MFAVINISAVAFGVKLNRLVVAGIFLLATQVSFGHPTQESKAEDNVPTLETIQVEGRATNLLGIAGSASQGVVGQPEFKYRPLARVGELVEVVPGALATQHSGSGQGQSVFLRGFNLDHGTDFSVMVDGVPMNMPTHAHGQGYLDLHSVIPELVDKVENGKGPYYADVGDLSLAGDARMHTMHPSAPRTPQVHRWGVQLLPYGVSQFTHYWFRRPAVCGRDTLL